MSNENSLTTKNNKFKNDHFKSNNNCSSPLFSKITMNMSNMLGPAIFVSAVPNWTDEDDLKSVPGQGQKRIFQYSAFVGVIFKIIFSICFSYLITFGSDFSMQDYILTHKNHEDSKIYIGLIVSLVVFLFLTLINGIVTHIESLNNCIKSHSSYNFASFYWIVSVFSPWILSLLLVVNGRIFLNLLNWSSIFLFGYVNFVLPLLLYVEAICEAENFENNYKQSAILDFENFICLKNQEICSVPSQSKSSYEEDEQYQLIPLTDPNLENIQNIFKEIQSRLGPEMEIETKERIVNLLYELEGFYSLTNSYSILFGGLSITKSKISLLFYSIILFLLLFMFFSIYFALYNFFINKTLVVNIFLQIK